MILRHRSSRSAFCLSVIALFSVLCSASTLGPGELGNGGNKTLLNGLQMSGDWGYINVRKVPGMLSFQTLHRSSYQSLQYQMMCGFFSSLFLALSLKHPRSARLMCCHAMSGELSRCAFWLQTISVHMPSYILASVSGGHRFGQAHTCSGKRKLLVVVIVDEVQEGVIPGCCCCCTKCPRNLFWEMPQRCK